MGSTPSSPRAVCPDIIDYDTPQLEPIRPRKLESQVVRMTRRLQNEERRRLAEGYALKDLRYIVTNNTETGLPSTEEYGVWFYTLAEAIASLQYCNQSGAVMYAQKNKWGTTYNCNVVYKEFTYQYVNRAYSDDGDDTFSAYEDAPL
jgi:hypothetical protein